MIVLGLASRRWLHGLPAKLAGDAFYTILVYVTLFTLRFSITRAAVGALGFSVVIELLQLTGLSAWLASKHVILRLIFGTTFGAIDLVGYALGAAIAAIVHTLLTPPSRVITPVLAANPLACPEGFQRLFAETRVRGGDFAAAAQAIRTFAHYPAWTRVRQDGDRHVVAIRAGLTTHHAFTVHITERADLFALTITTLPDHAEIGEERFSVTRDGDDLILTIVSYSRPGHWYARLGAPVVRLLQRRFLRDTIAKMACLSSPSSRAGAPTV